MSFNELIDNLKQVNNCKINSKAILSQVTAAMKLAGDERDLALKQVMLELFPKDAEEYERVRQEGFLYIRDCMGNEDELDEYLDFAHRYKNRMQPAKFMESYALAISMCAKEIDPDYESKYMLGITIDEAKTLQTDCFNSFTFFDVMRYELFTTRGIEKCRNDIELARFDSQTHMTSHYPTENQVKKSRIEDVYIRKEILKDELGKRGFFWRLFNSFQTYEMREFIKAAEKVLKEVDFTQADAVRVDKTLSDSATSEEEIGWTFDAIDAQYAAEEKRQAEKNGKDITESISESDEKKKISVPIANEAKEREVSQPVQENPTVTDNTFSM